MYDALLERLEDGIAQIAAFLPQLAMALGFLLAGYAIAKLVERGTERLLRRIGFDRWMREGGVTEALARAGTTLEPSTVLAKIAFWTVMLLVILVASNALGLAVVSALFSELLAYIPNVIAAVIILILGIVLGEFVKDLVLASAGKTAQAVGLLAFCGLVVTSVDSLLRPRLVGQDTRLHELMVLFGTLGGIGMFGAAGILLGPLVAALVVTAWEIYAAAFREELDGREACGRPGAGEAPAQESPRRPEA